jgi:hypothetical protein
MSVMDSAARTSLVNRVRAILLRPKEEWQVIDKETTDIATLYRTYVMPLAAIGPVANFIGLSIIGTSTPLGTSRVPIVNGLIGAIVAYALALATTYVVAMVIDNLAPANGGARNMVQAFKVSAYSSTAQWIAGIFGLIPGLSPLSILGIYGLYLLYIGLPMLMKAPAAKATSYTLAVIVAVIVLFIVITIVTGLLFAGAVIATL